MRKHIDIPDRAAVAKKVGTSEQYLYQISTGRRKAGRLMAEAIERATEGATSAKKLRPDLFGTASRKARAA